MSGRCRSATRRFPALEFFGTGLRAAVTRQRGGLPFGFGVQLGAEQYRQPGQVEPEDEDHHSGERPIGLAVRAELGHVEREAERGEQEDDRAEQAARADPTPARRLAVRPDEVVDREQRVIKTAVTAQRTTVQITVKAVPLTPTWPSIPDPIDAPNTIS